MLLWSLSWICLPHQERGVKDQQQPLIPRRVSCCDTYGCIAVHSTATSTYHQASESYPHSQHCCLQTGRASEEGCTATTSCRDPLPPNTPGSCTGRGDSRSCHKCKVCIHMHTPKSNTAATIETPVHKYTHPMPLPPPFCSLFASN